MMLFSSTEAVTTAKASNIMANLTHIRKAVIMWYSDNRERITYIPTDKTHNTDLKFYYNDIKYNSIQDALSGKPHSTNDKNHENYNQTVSFLSYMDGLGGINEKGDTTQYAWSYLANGGYGVNDAGTEWRRQTWFAGYTFQDGDDAIKRKIWGRKNSLGLIFTAGERPNTHKVKPIQDESQLHTAKSVWLRIMGDAECNGIENDYKNK